MRTAVAALVLGLGTMTFVGCASRHEEGVTSTYRSQYEDVAADTKTTTQAAEAVLNDMGLKSVNSTSTAVDGKATAKLADGTDVKVGIDKETAMTSKVTVTVGMIGDPKLGAEIAKKTKMKAEGMKTDSTRNGM